MEPELRLSGSGDTAAISRVLLAAFGEAEGREIVGLVDELLVDPSARPSISLVATFGEDVVGHILFTGARIESDPGTAAGSLLAPLAVHPDHQRRGIGGLLVRDGLRRLRESGIEWVFVLGSPAYYGRFGFSPAGERGFEAPHAIPAEPAGAWMSLGVGSGPAEIPGGRVRCADAISDEKYWRW